MTEGHLRSLPMAQTVISPLIHSPDEHSIVALPSSELKVKIAVLQNELRSLLGDAIWVTPADALHSTLMEIIADTEYTGLTRGQQFMEWYERYHDVARDVIARSGPLDVWFDKLQVSQAAIIIRAADPTSFNDIRRILLTHTALPAQTRMPPDIVHITIARFSKVVDLDDIHKRTGHLSVDAHELVREFRLMKDLGPDFHPTCLETYPLGAHPSGGHISGRRIL